jgi:hypothetical protein
MGQRLYSYLDGPSPKANNGILITKGGVTSGKTANRATVHLNQGVRHHAEGHMAVGWNSVYVLNNPLGVPSSNPLYSCLPLIWGAGGGDLLDHLYSWDRKWTPTKRKLVCSQINSLPRRSLQEILQ